MKGTLEKLPGWIVDLFVIGVGISSILGFLGRIDWRLELFSHFRMQYLALHILGLLIALALRKSRTAWLAGGFIVFHLWFVLPFYVPISSKVISGSVHR